MQLVGHLYIHTVARKNENKKKLNTFRYKVGLLFFNYRNDARSNIHKIYVTILQNSS